MNQRKSSKPEGVYDDVSQATNRMKAVAIGNGRTARLTYRHVNVLLFFGVATQEKWHLVTRDPSEDQLTTRKELAEIYPDIKLPKITLWERWSFLGVTAIGTAIYFLWGTISSIF